MDSNRLPQLGFGLMRLPKLADDRGKIDIASTTALADRFLTAGGRYFDTAYVYDGGLSEEAFRTAVTTRYPRDAYWLTDKLPVWKAEHPDELESLFQTSLDRCGVEWFDLYLLHSLGVANNRIAVENGSWDFLYRLKEEGRARSIGFSFHDSAAVLASILQDHHDVDFVQLQVNYADWNDADVESKACYELVRSYGIPVIIMEPVKGGALAVMPDDIHELVAQRDPSASVASWAFRFCASLDWVFAVLSGMNSLEQLEDNIAIFEDARPLTDDDEAFLTGIADKLHAKPLSGCTACAYCEAECPQSIEISNVISILDAYHVYGSKEHGQHKYDWMLTYAGDPASCIHCGACEQRCPQHLAIESLVEETADIFG